MHVGRLPNHRRDVAVPTTDDLLLKQPGAVLLDYAILVPAQRDDVRCGARSPRYDHPVRRDLVALVSLLEEVGLNVVLASGEARHLEGVVAELLQPLRAFPSHV